MSIAGRGGLHALLPAIEGRVADRCLRLSIRVRIAVLSGLGIGRICIAIGRRSLRGQRENHITLRDGVTDSHA